MKRWAIALFTLMMLGVMGCSGGLGYNEAANLNCYQVADLSRIPSGATATGVEFVIALHSYDTRRIHDLVVPDQRELMVRQAFNGPNASPVKMLETPKVTDGSLCDKAIKLTISTRAAYSGGYKHEHTIYLTLQQHGSTWLVADMAADFDS